MTFLRFSPSCTRFSKALSEAPLCGIYFVDARLAVNNAGDVETVYADDRNGFKEF